MIAGIRAHWDGLFAFGAPDVQVVNVTKDAICVRDATLPESSGQPQPSIARMIGLGPNDPLPKEIEVPQPKIPRESQQEQDTRNNEIDPHKYYPQNLYREPFIKLPNPIKMDVEKMMAARKNLGSDTDDKEDKST